MDKSLFGGKYLKDLKKTHSDVDLKMLEQIRELQIDTGKYINVANLNATDIQINMKHFSAQS